MTRLVIEATPLIDRWSVTSVARRDRVQWPPSPDTIFSALVAAAASIGNACHPALRWLESLGNPVIEASAHPPTVEAMESFSPVADRTEWEKGARQSRFHNTIGEAQSVAWSWNVDDIPHLGDLQRIAAEVTYIGSSRGPVLARAFLTEAPTAVDALVPQPGGPDRIRGLYEGRLDELEAAYRRGERPRPAQTVGYIRANAQKVVPIWEKLIPLRRVRGQALDISLSAPVAEAIRDAIMRQLPNGAPPMLTGHAADGSTLRDGHIAVVPMPRVGDSFADGELLGMALMLPRGMSDTDYAMLMEALLRWQQAGGMIKVGPIEWALDIPHDDHRKSLSDTRFEGNAESWTTVTPVVFDRHPRRALSVHNVVAAMCRDASLPEPVKVDASSTSWLIGGADISKHHLGGRHYLAQSYIAHLRLTWSHRVPGPIILGRGRYFGLGIMLPAQEAA